VKRYKLVFWGKRSSELSIQWDSSGVTGDCLVVAIKEGEEEDSQKKYTNAMPLEEVKTFIEGDTSVLGLMIHDCKGVIVGDLKIDFEDPIEVRNNNT